MAILKKSELKNIQPESAKSKITDLRKELMKANAQIAIGTIPENPGRIREMKKTLAKLKMIIHQRKKENMPNIKGKGVVKKV